MSNDNAVAPTATHYIARTALLTVPNAYLAKEVISEGGVLNYLTSSGYIMRSVVVIIAPSTLVCGVGAMECTAISVVSYMLSREESAKYYWNGAQAFMHGALFFPSGYTLIGSQLLDRAKSRDNKNDRLVDNTITLLAIYGIGNLGCKTIKYGCKGTYHTLKFTYDVLDTIYVVPVTKEVVKFTWKVTSSVASFAGNMVQTALGGLVNAAQSVLKRS